jgi:hypothetical protein
MKCEFSNNVAEDHIFVVKMMDSLGEKQRPTTLSRHSPRRFVPSRFSTRQPGSKISAKNGKHVWIEMHQVHALPPSWRPSSGDIDGPELGVRGLGGRGEDLPVLCAKEQKNHRYDGARRESMEKKRET